MGAKRGPKTIDLLGNLNAAPRGGSLTEHLRRSVRQAGHIPRFEKRARAVDVELQGDKWRPMIFQNEHGHTVAELGLDGLGQFDAQDLA